MCRSHRRYAASGAWVYAFVSIALTGCVLTQTHVGCCDFLGGKRALLQKKFELTQGAKAKVPADSTLIYADNRPVFVAKPGRGDWKTTPPVLLLHEMPGLSPDALELAYCVAQHGYTVYVPLLFGDFQEDSDSRWLFIRRSFSFRFNDRLWMDAYHIATRVKAVDAIEELARKILDHHATRTLAVIGLCITGSLPMNLAADMPEVVAPVVSQPAIPLRVASPSKARDIGLDEKEVEILKTRIAKDRLQILGFRFQYDHVCPSERFTTLRQTFGIHGFLDRTLPGDRYERIDHLPHGAHAVLTLCYQPWIDEQNEPATHYAYRQLLAFLDAKLKNFTEYRDPPILRQSDDPRCDQERGRCFPAVARVSPKVE
jgi:dienelactone hydrolase